MIVESCLLSNYWDQRKCVSSVHCDHIIPVISERAVIKLGGNVGVMNGPTTSGGMMLMKSMLFLLASSIAAFSASILETKYICNEIKLQGNMMKVLFFF